jgi:hypothetical protein
MQYTEPNSWVMSLKVAHVCARKIADVLIAKTFGIFFASKQTIATIF